MVAWLERAEALDSRRRGLPLVGRKDPALNQPASQVGDFDEALLLLARRMFITCRDHRGVAIAAPQVGHPIKMIVQIDGTVMVNPVVEAGGKLIEGPERCLSLPGRRFSVPRHQRAIVVGQDIDGAPLGCDATDEVARMWAHEDDHLAGRLLIGRFPVAWDPLPT